MPGGLLCLGLVVGAPALKGKPVADSLLGDWVMDRAIIGGRPSAAPPAPIRYRFGVDGQWFIDTGAGERRERYAADPAAKPAATIDLGGRRGIYKIDGGKLTICIARFKDALRPTAFESPGGSDYAVYYFTRVKPDKR